MDDDAKIEEAPLLENEVNNSFKVVETDGMEDVAKKDRVNVLGPGNSADIAEATVFSTVLNLINNIIGAGILSLPHSFKDASIVGGTVIFLIVGALSSMSMILIAICCEHTNSVSFRQLGDEVVGRRFGVALQVVMFVYTSLSCISFLILVGDFFSGDTGIVHSFCDRGTAGRTVDLLPQNSTNICDGSFSWVFDLLSDRFNVVLLVTTLILLPLSCMRDLHALRHTSLVSAFGMIYLVVFLMYKYYQMPLTARTDVEINMSEISLKLFSAAPIVNVAFVCHYNGPKYYYELKDRSVWKFSIAVGISFSCCFFVYLLVALFGYLSFGEATAGDILTNFPYEDRGAIFARLCLSLVVMFTYPLAFNALRLSALALLEELGIISLASDAISSTTFTRVTVFLVAVFFFPGALLTEIAVVLDYKGSLLGGCIGFAFVAIFFFSYLEKRKLHPEWVSLVRYERFWSWWSYAFIFWGITTGVLGIIVTTKNLLER